MSSSFRSRLEREFLPFVEKPLRYLGNELNLVRKDLRTAKVHGVLCFPDVYDIGMSHHGTQILYHIVNRHDSWALSRCYHPWPDAEALLREKNIPLYGLEQCTPLDQVDWLGFTVQYELQYTNLINMLDLSGIPLRREMRDERHPLVIAGGPCMVNPEPLSDFVDAFVIGDGERVVEQLCEAIATFKQQGSTREVQLRTLGGIPGVYVPSLYPVEQHGCFCVALPGEQGSVAPAKIPQLSSEDYPTSPLVPLIDITHNRMSVEVMRGCTRGCRFCSAGFYYRPVRERSPESIAEQVRRGMAATGWREAGLLSLSTADHSRLPELLGHIATLKEASHVKVSLPSTRIDALSPEQFALLKDVSPVSSVTIAPEAGSQRLRNVINKDFSEQTITDTVGALLDNNVQTIKLYFMIGLPTENEADIDEMIRLIRDISVMARARGRRRQVNVAISPFSPKPSTPFQWEAMTGVDVLLHRSRRIKQELSEMRNVKVSYRDPDITLLETVMARGDRRVGALVMQAWKLGARFDGWDEHFDIDRWNRAARETGLSLQPFLQEIPEDVAVPWDVVCAGITRDFLLRERRRAYAEAITPDCRTGSCGACGLRRLCRLQPRNRDVATSQAAEPPPRPRAKSSAPKQPDQFWFRGVFSKMEGARFLSHRDTMELFHRAFLAAGVPLAFSQGFNPHPRMSFGPPLMLGAQGSCELFDFALLSRTAPELASLNRLLPSGLDITEAAALPGKPKSLMSVTIAGVYRIVPLVAVSLGEAGAAVESFMSKESVEVMPQREGKPAKDIRPLVEHVRVIAGSDGPAMEAILSLRGGATCRPEELIRALFPGRHWGEFLVTRTQLLQDPIPTS